MAEIVSIRARLPESKRKQLQTSIRKAIDMGIFWGPAQSEGKMEYTETSQLTHKNRGKLAKIVPNISKKEWYSMSDQIENIFQARIDASDTDKRLSTKKHTFLWAERLLSAFLNGMISKKNQ
jgi:hypothetical protein